LIIDEERLRAERSDRRNWKSRVTGLDDSSPPHEPPRQRRQPRRDDEDDDELRRAIEASRTEAEADEARRRREAGKTEEVDADLAKALKLSKEEEDLRRRELEEANANSLFDDTPAQPAVAQPTGWNQGYQQQPSVDWFGNVIDPQQQQNTGFGLQSQQTGYPNGNGYGGYQQPVQNTGFPYGQQQQPQQNFLQQQPTSFNMNNPYGQQVNGNGFGQQPLQQQDTVQAGSNNPWAHQSQDPLKPQPTGSNNPFASAFNRPQSAQTNRIPTLSSLQEQKATTSFNPIQNYQAPLPVQQPVQQQQPFQQQQQQIPQDPHKARLNALLASGEGQDTFGNVGDLRIPSQHTAPGTFVNSAGAGAGRLTQNATGNPFLNTQFTGMPQTNRMMPAQTGPAGSYGVAPYNGQNNPFGGVNQNGQQLQQRQQGGSLIDL
jgi:epsin